MNDNNIRIHIRETDGKYTPLLLFNTVNQQKIELIESDAIGNPVNFEKTSLNAFESKFFIFKTK
jgi:hypothetical protein